MSNANLKRFLDAQQRDYAIALTEIRAGHKRNHWMWYIFPQITGLGFSEMSERYAIADLPEATAYLHHPVLGNRLREIAGILLDLTTNDPREVMGSPDDLKLRSSMTLFAQVPGADPVFQAVLKKYFHGEKDKATLQLL
jgi:uncharacterized protein (DUF1810 family)